MRNRHALRQANWEHSRLASLDRLIDELTVEADELDHEIAAEEAKSGIGDPRHFAYPTYARAAIQRRDNLRRSVEQLVSRRVSQMQ
jgi:flagellar protein FliJ